MIFFKWKNVSKKKQNALRFACSSTGELKKQFWNINYLELRITRRKDVHYQNVYDFFMTIKVLLNIIAYSRPGNHFFNSLTFPGNSEFNSNVMSVWNPTDCYTFSNEIKASSKIHVKEKRHYFTMNKNNNSPKLTKWLLNHNKYYV